MKQYTQEYLNYIKKYPYSVLEDFKNGIKNNLVFSSEQDMQRYITRMISKNKKVKYTITENKI